MPFTAARARNEGFNELMKHGPFRYIQFIDGDCEIQNDWVSTGIAYLELNPDYAVVCGRRRERYPDRSIYNLLCDWEWNTPVGDAKSCGGDSIMRCEAFLAVKGFNSTVIAGEEPELCVRLRHAGWRIKRLDSEMTLHDAAILHFSQWWKRSKRAGYAYALGAYMHGRPPERHWIRECIRIWFWALLPFATLAATVVMGAWASLILLLYPVSWAKCFAGQYCANGRFDQAAITATALLVCKFPEFQGQLLFLWKRIFRKESVIIEYKSVG